jgi:hypothetical protein
LLNSLKKEKKFSLPGVAWSNMEKGDFMSMINQLKDFVGNQPFWKLEVFWKQRLL